MRFVADCMLGKLAKWLKILGFDTAFFSRIDDDDLLDFCRKEKRILLTRDTDLIERARGMQTLFIESEDWPEQIQQVMDTFQIRGKARPYTRCIECNTALKGLAKERARNLVTPFVFERAEKFALCPRCGRVFWKGTHLEDMDSKVGKIFKKSSS